MWSSCVAFMLLALGPRSLHVAAKQGAEPVPEWFVKEADAEGNPLASWFANRSIHSHGQRRAQKWSQYLRPYHRHLSKFRGRDIRVLELGVQSGGSLMMWLDYFGDKAHVYGADVETAVRVVAKDRPGRIQVIIGDQGDPSYLRRLCQEIGPGRIDFILDDASHVPWHQILGVEQLFPCLNPDGGVYMVEDLGTIDDHRGKNASESIIAYAHAKAIEMQATNPVSQEVSRSRAQQPLTMWQKQLESVSVYGSLVVFEKIRQRHFFNLDAGRKVIPKRTVGFVGMPREQALAKAREEGQHWA